MKRCKHRLKSNFQQAKEGPRSFRLLNVLSGEVWELCTDQLDEMMQMLLCHHFRPQADCTDEQFIQDADACRQPAVSFADSLKSYMSAEDGFGFTRTAVMLSQMTDSLASMNKRSYSSLSTGQTLDCNDLNLSFTVDETAIGDKDVEESCTERGADVSTISRSLDVAISKKCRQLEETD